LYLDVNIQTSIIIPTLHRKKSLLRLLDSLIPQMNTRIEIIVVEQGDNNGNELQRYAKKHGIDLKYIFTDKHNTARAKNIGVQQASGKYFVFFDDDVVVHKDDIKNLIKNFSDQTIGCAAGRAETVGQSLELYNKYVGRISFLATFSDGYSSTIRQDIDTPVGCNMAFPLHVIQKVGGFDEQYTAAIREESDLALRIKKFGYRIVFDPTSSVTHMREVAGGGRKTEGRMQWYFHFLSNETYFFLKHRPVVLLPLFLLTKTEWVLRCMFGFGREVSIRSMVTPFAGILDGIKKYSIYRNQISDRIGNDK
jgi:GT2 family glycosyltransferase